LRVAALAMPGLAASMVFSGGLRGAGDTRWPLLISSLSVWIIRLGGGALVVYGLGGGLLGAWAVIGLDLTTRGVLFWWRFRAGRWMHIEL
ncbi:MAG: MATE family efflux transporter, partial [Chloroflexi bacterium]|nr:MATE family efflux transporter [Chloroflexota bacterium]